LLAAEMEQGGSMECTDMYRGQWRGMSRVIEGEGEGDGAVVV